MSDLTNFDDYLVDAWFEEGCLWSRFEGVVKDMSSTIKSAAAPAVAAVALGAVVFAAPVLTWGNRATSLQTVAPVKSAKADYSREMQASDEPGSSSDISVKEVAKLSDDLRDVFARMRAGDVSHMSPVSLALAEKAVASLAAGEEREARAEHRSTRNKFRIV